MQLDIDGIGEATEIGRGGFGVVYRATETEFGRPVAIKVLLGDFDERARLRFDRERLAMGSLSGHPNIVTIHRSGFTPQGQPFLLMEYLDGGSISDRLRQFGRLPWPEVATLGTQIGGALAAAHEAGVLHRDVKPGNILLAKSGVAKLGDFGIARLHGAPETQSAIITASIAHAPPEVIGGARPDERADVYSLASTLFELAWGSPAFVGPEDESLVPMLSRIALDAPPDLSLVDMPQPMIDVMAIAMAKEREQRFPTAAAFTQALGEAQARSTQPQEPAQESAQPRSSASTTHVVSPLISPPQPASGEAPTRLPDGSQEPGASPRSNRNWAIAALLAVGLVGAMVAGALAIGSNNDEQSDGPLRSTTGSVVAEPLTTESPASESGASGPVTQRPETTIPAPSSTVTTATGDSGDGAGAEGPDPTSAVPGTDSPSPVARTRQAVSRTGAISVLVPESWAEESSDQVSLLVTVDLERALADEWVKGAYFEAVRNTPAQNPGGFAPDVTLNQLIAESECTLRERGPYGDFAFTGSYAVLDQCGDSGLSAYFLVAAPADLSMVVLVAVQFESPEEDAIVELLLNSVVWSIGGLP